MKLSIDQVKKVAKLANLPLNPSEEEKYSKELSAILDYIDKLNSVNTDSIEPTFNVTGQSNIFAEDITDKSLSQGEAVKNASSEEKGLFITKGVFEES